MARRFCLVLRKPRLLFPVLDAVYCHEWFPSRQPVGQVNLLKGRRHVGVQTSFIGRLDGAAAKVARARQRRCPGAAVARCRGARELAVGL